MRHVTTASTNSTSVPATTVNLNTKTNVTVGSVRTSNVISTKVTPLVSLQGRNSGPDKAGKALITASSHIQATQQQRVPITQTSKVVTNSQGSTQCNGHAMNTSQRAGGRSRIARGLATTSVGITQRMNMELVRRFTSDVCKRPLYTYIYIYIPQR